MLVTVVCGGGSSVPRILAVLLVGKKAVVLGAALVLLAAQAVGRPPADRRAASDRIALNPTTDTIYVGNGILGRSRSSTGGGIASTARGCRQRLTAVMAGVDPIGIAIDGRTGTLYVANASGTVVGRAPVQRLRHLAMPCPACDGEGRAEPAVPRGDEKTHTVYVANSGADTVSVIDARDCNAGHTSGCKVVATAKAGKLLLTLAVNDLTGTLYVADLGAGTVSVLDAGRCNATNISGQAASRRRSGSGTSGDCPRSRTNTVYVTGQVTNDVWVIDGKTHARVRSGCGRTLARVPAGPGARGIAPERTDTIYVANTAAGTVSVIDGSRRLSAAAVARQRRRHRSGSAHGAVVDDVTNTSTSRTPARTR